MELSDGGRVDLDSENGDLTIRDLSYDDTGNYTCVAETGAGSDNVTHNVTISGLSSWALPVHCCLYIDALLLLLLMCFSPERASCRSLNFHESSDD